MADTQKKTASLYSAFKEIINPHKLSPASQTVTNGDMNNILLQINEMMRKIYNKAFASAKDVLKHLGITLTATEINDLPNNISNLASTVNNKVSKSGDTITGSLKVSSSISIGEKTSGNDGKSGVSMGKTGYLLMQRSDGGSPYIAFYTGDSTSANGHIQQNSGNGYMEFRYADRYTFDKAVYAPSFYENNEALSAKYVPAANFNGFKVYTLADLGITGNTTFNAVCSALSSLKSNNPWMFICAQGVLTSGITDMPEGYGLLTVTQIAGRFSVEYKAPNKLYFSLRNETQMKEIKPSLLKSISPD